MTPGAALEYRRLRAPRENGASLVEPPFSQLEETIAHNIAQRERYEFDLGGRSLQEICAAGRQELLAAARRYTGSYRDVPATAKTDRILLAGHQPELYHPGVWCKNFALSSLAQRTGATAINLVVDSDRMKRSAIRVPGGTVSAPVVADVAFDDPTAEIPYEDRLIQNREELAGFARRVTSQLGGLVPGPLVREFWPRVVERSRDESRVGLCVAQARHQLEGDWGLASLEIPQSLVCQLESFLWFTAYMLYELPRLREIYNRCVARYRQVNHIRSLNHPVPDLAEDDGWFEAPYWIWSDRAPRRRRLFVRQSGGSLELTDRADWKCGADCRSAAGVANTAVQLSRLNSAGIRLRSRALLTTLFARLVLGDLFIHGIGGAKYDELTDLIIHEFFGFAPPRYMLLTGTLLLPIEHERASFDDERRLNQRLREIEFHPETFIDRAALDSKSAGDVAVLVDRKRRWIETAQTKENARERCREIRAVNESLQPFLNGRRTETFAERDRLGQRLAAEQALSSREYAFCLYPEQTLRDFMSTFQQFGPA